MAENYSAFHGLDGLSNDADANGLTRAMFGAPRAGPVAPTVMTRSDGLSIALPTFEFGLVLAGAVSAGAYTAGVVDYLIETLDRFEQQKRVDFEAYGLDFARWTVPPHSVRLRVAAGASAGSVVGATLAVTARGKFPSGASLSPGIAAQTSHASGKLPEPHWNPLYNIWVRQLDIRAMLHTDDLAAIGDQPCENPETGRNEAAIRRLASLLNVQPLDRAAAQTVAFNLQPLPAARGWLGFGARFAFTVGNLGGIPYRYRLPGLEGAQFATTRHADLFRFRLDNASATPVLEEGQGPQDSPWARIAEAALASAAFPVALQSRWLGKPATALHDSIRLDPRVELSADPVGNRSWTQAADIVAGYVNSTQPRGRLTFAAVDGGTMNNQPFEFVRQTLAGPLGQTPPEGNRADRAVVLIDPFPAPPAAEQELAAADPRAQQPDAPLPLLEVLPKLFSAYTAQARYDANDHVLAAEKGVYNQYMLSPMRADPTPDSWHTFTGAEAIASGGLGAFAGFLSESFRHHDFLLGRRNAENFLRNYFSVTADNPLFRTPGRVGDSGKEQLQPTNFWAAKGNEHQPIGPYWTITCDGHGRHERCILPVPMAPDAWADHGPATGHPYLNVNDPAERERMERARKLAVRARLQCPTPEWPDPAAQAEQLVDELSAPIRARIQGVLHLALLALGTSGLLGMVFRLGRPMVERALSALLARKMGETLRKHLSG